MHEKLNKFLEQETCSCSQQFGFCPNCSINNALMPVIENIQTQLNDSKYVSGVLTWKKSSIQLTMITRSL